jgi:hypothetical protein
MNCLLLKNYIFSPKSMSWGGKKMVKAILCCPFHLSDKELHNPGRHEFPSRFPRFFFLEHSGGL